MMMTSRYFDIAPYRRGDGYYVLELIEDHLRYGALAYDSSHWLASEGDRVPVVYRKELKKKPEPDVRLLRLEGWRAIEQGMVTERQKELLREFQVAWAQHWDFVDHIRAPDGEDLSL